MSSQSYIYNPQEDRIAATGAGFQIPRLTTTQRLATVVGPGDAGLTVFDTTLGTLWTWNGVAWTTPSTIPYAEGTWDADFVDAGGGAAFTLGSLTGSYEKIGLQVHVSGRWVVDGVVGAGIGDLLIGGLPFPVRAGSAYDSVASLWAENLNASAKTQIVGVLSSPNPSQIRVSHYENGNVLPLSPHISIGTIIGLSLTYRTT